MGVRNLKPVTPGSRFASRSDFSEITTDKPEKSLTVALRKKGGRNNTGRITVRETRWWAQKKISNYRL